MRSFFEHPGSTYNFITLCLSVVGVILGLWALFIAYVQLKKTLNAAEAARTAAETTRHELTRVMTVIDVQKLSALCIEIMTVLESGGVIEISRPLHQLRMGLAEFHETDQGQELGAKFGSIELVATIEDLQRKFDRSLRSGPDERVTRQCLTIVKSIDEKLHQMLPQAAKM